ncbi:MAG: hypothetical protein Q9157_005991 [Trypethelium eluteriae]
MDKIVTELQKVKSELHKRLSQVIGPLLHHIRPAELISSLIEVDGLERSVGGFQYTNVPYTVQDAIRHTQTFGYQYLWVDSICIVQDDSEEVSSQLDQMCDIYGGAELTLVAAQGKDASHGMHTFWPPPTPAAKHLFPLDLNKFITPENLRGLVPSRFPEQDCEAEEIWLSALQWEEFTSETTPVYIPPLVVKSRLMLGKDYPKNGTPKIKDMFIPVHEASRKENEDHKGISGDLPPTLEKDWKRTPAGTFKHRSDIETEFLYPLPIPSEVPHLTTNQSQILRFNAQSIRFSLSKILSPRRHSCLTFLLGDHESNLVGIVRLNHSHDDSEARQQFERRTEEFIAISQGSVLFSALHLEKLPYKSTTYHSPFEELCELNCAQDKTYEFYNVLMVEWRNGIAHRKALGRVLKKAWDATPKRDVEVFLG